jgi:uroporphyrinogen III methyltransferase/synthase
VRPLAGRRVLVTRPREQAAELADTLTALGADVLVAPLIRIAPPSDPEPLRRAASDVGSFDWVVLTSANAADALARALLSAYGNPPVPKAARLCAVGPATAAQLSKHGLPADLIAEESTAEGVVAAMTAADSMTGKRVLLPKADIGREYVGTALTTAGAQVTEVVAYRTVAEESVPDEVRQALTAGRIDVVIFTSGSAVRSFASIFGVERSAVLRRTTIAVIGPTTADAARQLGIDVAIQPDTYAIPALVDAIVAYFVERRL